MLFGRRASRPLATLLFALLAACQQGTALGTTCARNADCASPLACRLGRCREECASDRDCPLAARCLRVDGAGACSLVEETNCPTQACPSGTVCLAGACATSCTVDADCPGGPCIDVTVGGTTIRGCGDARSTDAGVSDASSDAGIDASAGPDVVALAAGARTACALRSDGTMVCWGGNEAGQLGDGSTTHDGACSDITGTIGDHSVTPVLVALNGVREMALGDAHTCVRIDGTGGLGEARCWGDDGAGQLGNSAPGAGSLTPVRVVNGSGATLSGMLELSAFGNTTVARTATSLLGWGDGHDGQFGVDSIGGFNAVPIDTSFPAGVTLTSIVVTQAGVGIDGDGNVRTWGRNDHGALGNGTIDGLVHEDYAPVAGVSGTLEIELGYMAACARTASDVLCWGYPWSALGRDGDHSACADAEGSACARSVMGLPSTPVVDLAITNDDLCILLMGGDVYCTTAPGETLARRSDIAPMRSIVGGDEFFCGLSLAGHVFCWGLGTCGQTGDATHPTLGAPNEIVIP